MKLSLSEKPYVNLYSQRLVDLIKILPVLFLTFITLWFHLVNLGYSDYQGDEVKALSFAQSGQGFIDGLLQQKKGPTQFIATYLINLINPNFTNNFLTRLPFALAAIFAIYFFYKLVDLHFGKKIALLASLFLTTNGLVIGLTRIVQYQSFVMLFSIAALYSFSLAVYKENWRLKGLYAGMLLWAAAILSHYDGIFIAPFAAYLLYQWFTKTTSLSTSQKIKHLSIIAAVAGTLLAIFYIPFLFSVSEDTKSYWSFRLGITDTKAGLSSSVTNFRLYNPLLVFYLYVIFGHFSIPKIKQILPVLLWFLLPWEVLELVIFDPGTHIYTYLIPAAILLAFGLVVIEEFTINIFGNNFGKLMNYAGWVILFAFLASLSHFILIDHTPEYPWENRGYFSWVLSKPETKGDLWIFGFPYYRHWEEIGQFVEANSTSGYYSTNEKTSIVEKYLPPSEYQYDLEQSTCYIHIENPQSGKNKLANEKILYWTKNHQPDKVFKNNGIPVAELYLMAPGTLEEIKAQGY
jgi:hypothetical protein